MAHVVGPAPTLEIHNHEAIHFGPVADGKSRTFNRRSFFGPLYDVEVSKQRCQFIQRNRAGKEKADRLGEKTFGHARA
jgi:hypothetical protein